MIAQETIARILDTVAIEDVVSDYVSLTRRGTNLIGLCPFHNERTPSFSVSPARGIYKCFGCGKGGNALHFVMEVEQLSFIEAVRFLAKKAGIEVEERPQTQEDIAVLETESRLLKLNEWVQNFFQHELLEDEQGKLIGLAYFTERGISPSTLEEFGLGYCSDVGAKMTEAALAAGWTLADLTTLGLTIARENWTVDRFRGRVIFPIRSLSGKPIAFGGRALRTDDRTAKYVNSPESSVYHKGSTLFGLSFSRRFIAQKDQCLLVEGYMDVLSMWQRGVRNIVASSGTSLTVEQARLIRRFTKNITVLYDSDSAGIKAAERGAGILLEEGFTVHIVLLPEGQDPDDFARAHTLEEIEEYLKTQEQDFIRFITAVAVGESEADPGQMLSVVETVLAKIALIPDALLRALYIREASVEFKLAEQLLADTVNELRTQRGSVLRKDAEREVRRAEKSEELSASTQSPAPTVENEHKKALLVAERELVEVLLKHGDVVIYSDINEQTGLVSEEITAAMFFFSELTKDAIELTDPLLRAIYEEYRALHTEQSTADFQAHFTKHPDPAYSQFCVDLLVEKYTPSRRWEKAYPEGYGAIRNKTEIAQLAEQTLLIYKSRVVMLQLADLQQQIQETDDPERQEELFKEFNDRNDFRQLIASELKRIKL